MIVEVFLFYVILLYFFYLPDREEGLCCAEGVASLASLLQALLASACWAPELSDANNAAGLPQGKPAAP